MKKINRKNVFYCAATLLLLSTLSTVTTEVHADAAAEQKAADVKKIAAMKEANQLKEKLAKRKSPQELSISETRSTASAWEKIAELFEKAGEVEKAKKSYEFAAYHWKYTKETPRQQYTEKQIQRLDRELKKQKDIAEKQQAAAIQKAEDEKQKTVAILETKVRALASIEKDFEQQIKATEDAARYATKINSEADSRAVAYAEESVMTDDGCAEGIWKNLAQQTQQPLITSVSPDIAKQTWEKTWSAFYGELCDKNKYTETLENYIRVIREYLELATNIHQFPNIAEVKLLTNTMMENITKLHPIVEPGIEPRNSFFYDYYQELARINEECLGE